MEIAECPGVAGRHEAGLSTNDGVSGRESVAVEAQSEESCQIRLVMFV